MATLYRLDTNFPKKIRIRNQSHITLPRIHRQRRFYPNHAIFVAIVGLIQISASIPLNYKDPFTISPGNWKPSSEDPLVRISRSRNLNFNHLDGIRTVDDINEENGGIFPLELSQIARKDFPIGSDLDEVRMIPMRFGVESVKHKTPEENVVRYFERFSHPTINDMVAKRWPMNNPNAPPQKKYSSNIDQPWLRFLKPKNAMKWRKREDEKRQLKIIRLKKNNIITESKDQEIEGRPEESSLLHDDKWSKYINNNLVRLNNSKRQKLLGGISEVEQTDDKHFYPFQEPSQAQKRYFSNPLRVPQMSKKALKILRLKRHDSNSGSSGRMYLRNISTDKRALKILRLKKNTSKEDNGEVESKLEAKPNYVSVMNPTGQFRFGRSDPEFGKYQSVKRMLDELDGPEATLENDIGLYSRFY